METLFAVYCAVGVWVYIDTDDLASAILWPVWAIKRVWKD